MSASKIALATAAGGVIAFFAGLYGVVGERSLALALVGMIVIVLSLVALAFARRGSRFLAPHSVVVLVSGAALLLHMYEHSLGSSEISFAWVLWPLLPYVMCLAVSTAAPTRLPAIAGAVTALGFDAIAHYDVFISPKGSTAALALLFVPLWNTLVFAPLAMLAAWLFLRRRGGASDAP